MSQRKSPSGPRLASAVSTGIFQLSQGMGVEAGVGELPIEAFTQSFVLSRSVVQNPLVIWEVKGGAAAVGNGGFLQLTARINTTGGQSTARTSTVDGTVFIRHVGVLVFLQGVELLGQTITVSAGAQATNQEYDLEAGFTARVEVWDNPDIF